MVISRGAMRNMDAPYLVGPYAKTIPASLSRVESFDACGCLDGLCRHGVVPTFSA